MPITERSRFELLTVDGDTVEVDLADFFQANAGGLTEAIIDAIVSLEVGGTFRCGGGSAPAWSITRVPDAVADLAPETWSRVA